MAPQTLEPLTSKGITRCTQCGSKQWHKEPSSGLIACREGHVLQNYRNESRELDEFGAHGLRKRAIKSTRTKKGRASKADPKLYHGARGRFHYFQCQQLLLRKQIVSLTALWKLPPEFEIVCRDIWALHLSLLPDLPSPEPYFYLQEVWVGQGRSGEADKFEENDHSSSSDEEDIEEAKFATLLRLNSESDSGSCSDSLRGDSQSPSAHKAGRPVRKRGRDEYAYDGPASLVAVLVVACWTMRLPKLYMDFVRAIEAHELPYLDPIRLLPRELILHLTKHTVRALSPPHAPQTLTLHALASRLAKRMQEEYGIRTPEVNGAPILWRVIERLGGPPTLYLLTKALSDVLLLPLTLHPSLAAPLFRARKTDPVRHQNDNVPPELAFGCVAVVVLKMVHGLDGQARRPRNVDDPACVFPRVEEYIAYLRGVDAEEVKHRFAVMDSKSAMNAGDIGDEMVDDYLEFCERSLMVPRGDRDSKDSNSLLARYFPLPEDKSGRVVAHEERRAGVELCGTGVEEEEHRLRPGEEYGIYSSKDVFGSVSGELGAIVRRVGRVCGVDERYVMRVVEMLERRVSNQSIDLV